MKELIDCWVRFKERQDDWTRKNWAAASREDVRRLGETYEMSITGMLNWCGDGEPPSTRPYLPE